MSHPTTRMLTSFHRRASVPSAAPRYSRIVNRCSAGHYPTRRLSFERRAKPAPPARLAGTRRAVAMPILAGKQHEIVTFGLCTCDKLCYFACAQLALLHRRSRRQRPNFWRVTPSPFPASTARSCRSSLCSSISCGTARTMFIMRCAGPSLSGCWIGLGRPRRVPVWQCELCNLIALEYLA